MRVFALPLRKRVPSLAFVPDGSAITVLGDGLRFLSTFDRLTCFAYSGNGQLLAVGYGSGVTRVYRVGEIAPVAELVLGVNEVQRHRVSINSLAFAPTPDPARQWLAVAGVEFWLWNAATQQYLVAPDQDIYTAVAFAPTSDAVFIAHRHMASKYTIRPFNQVWRAELFPDPQSGSGRVVASPTGEILVVTGRNVVAALNATTGEWGPRFYHAGSALGVAFLPNSRLLAVADGSPTLRIYDTDTGTLAREYDWGIGGIHCVTFSHDGAMGAAGGDKGRVVVWDVD